LQIALSQTYLLAATKIYRPRRQIDRASPLPSTTFLFLFFFFFWIFGEYNGKNYRDWGLYRGGIATAHPGGSISLLPPGGRAALVGR
jgi:hypothetical protein